VSPQRCDEGFLAPTKLAFFHVPIAVETTDGDYLVLGNGDDTQRELHTATVSRTVDRVSVVAKLSGRYILIWEPFGVGALPISSASSTSDIRRLATMFAELDQQDSTLSDGEFNAPLSQRIMLFQQEYELESTGTMDALSYFYLQRALGD
jgi:hypothetical protein